MKKRGLFYKISAILLAVYMLTTSESIVVMAETVSNNDVNEKETEQVLFDEDEIMSVEAAAKSYREITLQDGRVALWDGDDELWLKDGYQTSYYSGEQTIWRTNGMKITVHANYTEAPGLIEQGYTGTGEYIILIYDKNDNIIIRSSGNYKSDATVDLSGKADGEYTVKLMLESSTFENYVCYSSISILVDNRKIYFGGTYVSNRVSDRNCFSYSGYKKNMEFFQYLQNIDTKECLSNYLKSEDAKIYGAYKGGSAEKNFRLAVGNENNKYKQARMIYEWVANDEEVFEHTEMPDEVYVKKCNKIIAMYSIAGIPCVKANYFLLAAYIDSKWIFIMPAYTKLSWGHFYANDGNFDLSKDGWLYYTGKNCTAREPFVIDGTKVKKITITGQTLYDEAYKVLDIVNAERKKEGLATLSMDEDLLKAAMERAAECSVYYSHVRPNGFDCSSILDLFGKSTGENIAYGYTTAGQVMDGWMNSQGHKDNIMNSLYKSIGIGCYYINGKYYWSQIFSSTNAKTAKTETNQARNYEIIYSADLVTAKLKGEKNNLKEGETEQLQICVGKDDTPIDMSLFEWSSSNPAIIAVDSRGKVDARSAGKCTITATNKNDISVACDLVVDKSNTNNSDKPQASPAVDPVQQMQQITSFAERMYTVVLARDAESAGLNYWATSLMNQEVDGAGIASGFINSPEFISKNLNENDYLDVLYRTFFDREAGADEKAYWISLMNTGMSRTEVLSNFVNSQEFSNICDSFGIARGTMQPDGSSIYRPGVRGFALRMYTKALSRNGETVGVEYWTNQLNLGLTTPEAVAKDFFFSEEYLSKNLSSADFIETLYQTFMDRESEPNGKAYWIDQLQNGMTREEALENFARCPEFNMIMMSYGL